MRNPLSPARLKRRVALAGMLGAATLLWASAASATTVIKMDMARLSGDAEAIVLGRVEATSSRWEEGRIITDVTLRVVIPLKGQPNAEELITVRRLGGTVGDLRQWIPGATDFARGEQLLVFLDAVHTDRADHLVVLGMAQGKWALAEGDDGLLYGVRDLDELSLAEIEEDANGNGRIVRIEAGSAVHEGAVPLERLLGDLVEGLRARGQEAALRPEALKHLTRGVSSPDLRAAFDAMELRLPTPAAAEVHP